MDNEYKVMLKTIINQIVSARWLLSLIIGTVYAYLACKEIIDPKDSLSVIMIVVSLYFSRNDRQTQPDKPEIPPK